MMSGGASPSVSPFNASWHGSIAIIALGSGAIRRSWSPGSSSVGNRRSRTACTSARWCSWSSAPCTGAAQLADFNTFHVFFAALAIFATPVAAVAVWSIWLRLRATGHVRLAVAVLVLCVLQIEFGDEPWRHAIGQLRAGQVRAGPGGRCWRRSATAAGRQARVRLPTARGGWVLVPVGGGARRTHRPRLRPDVLPGGDLPAADRRDPLGGRPEPVLPVGAAAEPLPHVRDRPAHQRRWRRS